MNLWDVIRERRTVRRFKPDPVPVDVLERLLDAAILAPSPLNSQPWRFIVTSGTEREAVADILREYPFYAADVLKYYPEVNPDEALSFAESFARDLGGAPHIVIVTTPTMDNEYVKKVNLVACGIAIENFMLAAWDLGIGTVCLTSAAFVEKKLLEHLGLANEEIVTAIPLGYPDERPTALPRDRSRFEFRG